MLGRLFPHNSVKTYVFQWIACAFLIFSLVTPQAMAEESLPETASAAEKTAEAEPEVEAPVQIVNTTLIANVDETIMVTLEGEALDAAKVHKTEEGRFYLNAGPIFASLGDDYEFDVETKALIVHRPQDGVVMELYTDTGIVKADGKPLGKLGHFGEVTEDRILLTANAIAVLSGAIGKFDDEAKTFSFELDPRLRVATGFDIIVNGRRLDQVQPAAKSIGPVLLLPLLPIAEELGHVVRVEGGTVFVNRAQDSAALSLDLDTGLISVRDNPIGIAKDVSYIDPVNLLLPVSALEALTGTNVDANGGSNEIKVDLDNRLAGAIKPTDSVAELTKNTPFTPESISFSVGPDVLNRVTFDAHGGRWNSRTRYEIPDLPTNASELTPAWLSVDLVHTKGMRGSIGDIAADNRELSGIGLSRLRGVQAQKVTEKGRWSAVAGLPTNGAKRISDTQSRQTFGGFAAGVNYADRDGWEASLSARHDNLSNDQMVVLQAISNQLNKNPKSKLRYSGSASVGVFNGDAREGFVDVQGAVGAQYLATESLTLDASATYVGAEFLRSDLDREIVEDEIIEALTDDEGDLIEDFIPDTRRRGSDRLSLNASARLTPRGDTSVLNNPAVGVRASYSQDGFLKKGEAGATNYNMGASAATGLGDTGISLSADASTFGVSYHDDTRPSVTGQAASVQIYKQFEDYTVRGQYRGEWRSDRPSRSTLTASVTRKAFNVPLPKEARLSIAPSVSGVLANGSSSVRGGVYANLNSGELFGEKNQVSASLGILQSVTDRNGSKTDQFLSVSYARQVRLGKNMALGFAYRNDLRGSHSIGLKLDGRFDFNEKRAYKEPKKGKGILKGRAFHDINRDGKKQDDEPPMGRIMIRVKRTKLALRTDNAGYFTIQNINSGIYDLQVDAETLPLGFDLADDVTLRVTIADGHITDIPVPVVQRGQIRGFAFVDENENGEYEKGEERIEGAHLQLRSVDGEVEKAIWTSSFGQYAFDDLPGGQYEISVDAENSPGIDGSAKLSVDLDSFDDLLGRGNLALYRRTNIRLADNKTPTPPPAVDDPPDDPRTTKVQAGEGPAPP